MFVTPNKQTMFYTLQQREQIARDFAQWQQSYYGSDAAAPIQVPTVAHAAELVTIIETNS